MEDDKSIGIFLHREKSMQPFWRAYKSSKLVEGKDGRLEHLLSIYTGGLKNLVTIFYAKLSRLGSIHCIVPQKIHPSNVVVIQQL